MVKGTGRFLARRNSMVTTGGQGFVRHELGSGDLVISNNLPDGGVYEVERAHKPCEYPNCDYQQSIVRRVDMRYLTKSQRGHVIDLSPKSRSQLEANV